MPTLNVDGDTLHFTDDGAGVPIIFVHGSCGGAGQWRALSGSLQDNYRTICVDLFGSGKSEPWPLSREWTVDDDSRALNKLLDMIGEPAHFIVHSAGGHFSFPTLKTRSEEILSLTLFEPVFFHLLRLSNDPLFSEPEGMANRYRAALDENDRDRAMASFVDSWAGAKGAWQGLPDQIKQMMQMASDRLYYEWLSVWFETPSRQDLAELQIPTLLFKGTDTIKSMHRVCEIVRQTLPQCRYAELEGAGHMSPFTHARQALPAIEEHLKDATA